MDLQQYSRRRRREKNANWRPGVWESALLHREPKRSQIERSLCGVFWPLQSLKIHLMLPPYVINYHFCLTLFSAPSVLGAHQSHPLCALVHRAAFFSLLLLLLCNLPWSGFFLIHLLWSFGVHWSPVDSLSLSSKSRSRQIVLGCNPLLNFTSFTCTDIYRNLWHG